MNFKKIIAFMTVAALASTGSAYTCLAEETAKDELVSKLVDNLQSAMETGENINIYSNLGQASIADKLPAKFDLRDRGVVPPVRSQGDFGTCWSFASIGASEISILSDLGMTVDDYISQNGNELNLSERHLAWFSSVPIQETEDMTEHDRMQIGEGRVLLDDDGSAVAHLSLGGIMGYASGMFASGIGPVPEEYVPYTSNEGTDSTAQDWSVDEDKRFAYTWELKDSSILPSPAEHDENGNYVYNENATEMIKQKLLEGHPVAIAYHSDLAMDPDAEVHMYIDTFKEDGIPEDAAALYIKVQLGIVEETELSEEELILFKKACVAWKMDVPYEDITEENLDELYASYEEENASEAEEADEDDAELSEEDQKELEEREAAARAAAERLGYDYDELIAEEEAEEADEEEAEEPVYMNTENYSQYVWDSSASADHAVVIVGYDDNYPAANFLEGNQPPADGAWIIRNSWGKNYGIDGYFYLSYYDQSIAIVESFEFVTDSDSTAMTQMEIQEYDYMPASGVNSTEFSEPLYLSNEFTIETDAVLTYVSTMTANLDTNVTAAVYLLNEESKSPIDGELLDVCSMNFEYAGYHRIPLNQHYSLPAGSKISVVETQRYHKADDLYYALPYTFGWNSEYTRTLNDLTYMLGQDPDNEAIEGRVGRDESFVGVGNEWYDLVDILDEVKEAYPMAKDFAAFDNHSIKIYLYPLAEISAEHNFGEPIPYAGKDVKLCEDCGYTLVEE